MNEDEKQAAIKQHLVEIENIEQVLINAARDMVGANDEAHSAYLKQQDANKQLEFAKQEAYKAEKVLSDALQDLNAAKHRMLQTARS